MHLSTASPRPRARLLAIALAAILAVPSLAFAAGDGPAPAAKGAAASAAPSPAPSALAPSASMSAPALTSADVDGPPAGTSPSSEHAGAAGPPPGSGTPWEHTVAFASGGVAIAAAVGGTVYGVLAFSRKSSAQSVCAGQTVCPTAEGVQRWNDADSAANTSTVLFFVAGLAVLNAAVFFLVPTEESTRSVQVGVGPGALELRGTFQ